MLCDWLIGRCLGKQYQIPILVSEAEISEKRKVELEEEIGATLDAKTKDGIGKNQQTFLTTRLGATRVVELSERGNDIRGGRGRGQEYSLI